MKKYKCRNCGLEVDTIPNYKKKECPKYIQHNFIKMKTTIKVELSDKDFKEMNRRIKKLGITRDEYVVKVLTDVYKIS